MPPSPAAVAGRASKSAAIARALRARIRSSFEWIAQDRAVARCCLERLAALERAEPAGRRPEVAPEQPCEVALVREPGLRGDLGERAVPAADLRRRPLDPGPAAVLADGDSVALSE